MSHKLIYPTPEEDAQITAAAMSDPDAIPFTDEEWAKAKVVQRPGRPRSLVTKPRISIRLDPDLLEALRASGPGWQTRINALLREAVTKGKV